MPTKDQVLRVAGQGRSYDEIARELGTPAAQAYLIATGIPADGGGTATRAQRQRPTPATSCSYRRRSPS